MRIALGMTTAALLIATTAVAQDSKPLNIEGEAMVSTVAAPAHMENVDTVYSGWHFRSDETQALQLDDFENPGMIFVDQAIDAWDTVDGSAGKACSSCHENVEDFAGLRTQLPRVENGALVTMENLINECRTDRMGAEAWKWSKGPMTAMQPRSGSRAKSCTTHALASWIWLARTATRTTTV